MPAADVAEGGAPAPTPTGSEPAPFEEVLVRQETAERVVLRDAIVGALIGMLVGAGIWTLIVVIAVAGSGWDMAPIVGVGVAVGIFAGAFYGGWAGTVIGNHHVEEAEHAALPELPPAGAAAE